MRRPAREVDDDVRVIIEQAGHRVHGVRHRVRRLRLGDGASTDDMGAEPEAGESHNEALSRRRFNRRAPVELKRTLRFGRAEDFAEEEVRLMERYAKPQMVMKEKV